MTQKLIFCSHTTCRRFFVDSIEERVKAKNNGWDLSKETLFVCGGHRYTLFGDAV